jgi:hypothetical protein
MNPLSKKELISRLQAIAADETPREEHFGAMCYSQMAPPEKHTKCELCGSTFSFHDWNRRGQIQSLVKQIKSLGYDVNLQVICRNCANKLKEELYKESPDIADGLFDNDGKIAVWIGDINFLFYFRTSSTEPYHRAIANHIDEYSSLLSLLNNDRMYLDSYDSSHYIADEKHVLKFMTGINFDE